MHVITLSVSEKGYRYEATTGRLRLDDDEMEAMLLGGARWAVERGHGDASWPGGELMLLIVITGEANLLCGGQGQPVRAGQTLLLLPGAAQSWNWTQPSGDWEILLAKLPVFQSSSHHS